ncbi:hypothetical protein [Vibrio alginolyticus]|uniref:hypothetical protein n=1 Tax=Vibrio alginolyticus TaxID=663 RepID=UPI0006CAA40D|nr:hypothetical protein [Vibrio alginolyticus]KPM98445.1 hypothetical protein AOG25_08350 [Vibrio alginolyticus]
MTTTTTNQTEIFHLAADGCDVEVVLSLDFTSVVDHTTYANVNMCLCVKSTYLQRNDVVELIAESNEMQDIHVNRLGWDASQIREYLKLPANAELKSKTLIEFFSKRYNFNLSF